MVGGNATWNTGFPHWTATDNPIVSRAGEAELSWRSLNQRPTMPVPHRQSLTAEDADDVDDHNNDVTAKELTHKQSERPYETNTVSMLLYF